MTEDYLNLSSGAWTLTYQTRQVSDRDFRPYLEPFYISSFFTDRFLIICTESDHLPSQYYRCGFVTQRTTVPGVGGGFDYPKVDLDDAVIPVNRCILLRFTKYSKPYQLFFTPVDYIKDFSLGVYVYDSELS